MLFFMIGMMKALIGMDYERGLRMLKEYVETGTVNSKTEFAGIVDVPTCQYLGVEGECSTDEIGKSMGETMPLAQQLTTDNGRLIAAPLTSPLRKRLPLMRKAFSEEALGSFVAQGSIETDGPPGALYHNFDMKGRRCKYTNIIPVKTAQAVSGAVAGEIQPCKAISHDEGLH